MNNEKLRNNSPSNDILEKIVLHRKLISLHEKHVAQASNKNLNKKPIHPTTLNFAGVTI